MKKIIHTTTTSMLLVLALFGGSSFFANATDTNAVPRKIVIMAKSIMLPEFKLDAVTFSEAIRQLHAVSKQHDPAHEGINFLVTDYKETDGSPKITLDLKNVTVEEATERLAKSAGLRVSAEDFAFVFYKGTLRL